MTLLDQAREKLTMTVSLFGHNIKFFQIALITVTFLLAVFIFLKLVNSTKKQPKKQEAPKHVLSSKDIEMLAGEDVVTTQLDLARAYIEMDKKHLAKSILFHVSKQGNQNQKQEARQLIDAL